MDDSTLTPQETGDRPLFTSRRHRRPSPERTAGLIIVVTLVAAAAGSAWLLHRDRARHSVPDGGPLAPAVASVAPASTSSASRTGLPPLDASDAFVRSLVSGLSARPRLAEWLATDGLVHRFVLSVVEVANGRSPGSPLAFLSPERPFRATVRDGRLVVDPGSYHRYDAMAATFASLDTRGTAQLYARLEPLFDDAYRTLGLRDEPFKQVLGRAFGRLLAVDFPETPPALVRPGVTYLFADPQLEGLSPAAKDLLRTGPDNGRMIQAKLRELAAALGVRPVPPS